MNRVRVLAICISLLSLGLSPRAVRADEKTEKMVTTTIVAAVAGGVVGLLIMLAGRQAEIMDELKKKSPPPRKPRAEVSPVGLKVHF